VSLSRGDPSPARTGAGPQPLEGETSLDRITGFDNRDRDGANHANHREEPAVPLVEGKGVFKHVVRAVGAGGGDIDEVGVVGLPSEDFRLCSSGRTE
jgi:hypothetical protein